MTRRGFLMVSASLAAATPVEAAVPVHHVSDARAKVRDRAWQRFWGEIWPETVRDFGTAGVGLVSTHSAGEIRRSPADHPDIRGLVPGVLNIVLTDRIPIVWDRGRGLSGVTTRYRGFHVCMLSLARAHCHQIPFLSVNTCVHELLHALLHDIFEPRPQGWTGEARELRIDVYATRLWLLGEGAAIRRAARSYTERLRFGLQSDARHAQMAASLC